MGESSLLVEKVTCQGLGFSLHDVLTAWANLHALRYALASVQESENPTAPSVFFFRRRLLSWPRQL